MTLGIFNNGTKCRARMMKIGALVFLIAISGATIAAEVDRVAARAWVISVESELSKAGKLFSKHPSDSQIGAQSNRIRVLADQGLALFPPHRDWLECRGAASYAWAVWWEGHRAVHEGLKGAKASLERWSKKFNAHLAQCKKELG